MTSPQKLLIFGASARAAAFSALRAGLEPWCADLFADADLQARCAVMRVAAERYPGVFLDVNSLELVCPWMYVGGLENHPFLLAALARQRPLWGNAFPQLRNCRSPDHLASLFRHREIPCPAIWRPTAFRPIPPPGAWLLKPLAGAGGGGIQPWNGRPLSYRQTRRKYFQQYLKGVSCSAIYLASHRQAQLLGATRQLVGEPWLHPSPFRYCGSIGPLPLDPKLRAALERIGNAVAKDCYLQGLFGVDCVLRDGVPYPVEINPRYTASVEVIEYATGISALALHRAVFDSAANPSLRANKDETILGKAILFARAPLTFPADGPWMATLRQPGDIWEMPAFADIPHPSAPIQTGQPILTFFARAKSPEDCRAELRRMAAELDRALFDDEGDCRPF